mgnify:CR=1 FL=1
MPQRTMKVTVNRNRSRTSGRSLLAMANLNMAKRTRRLRLKSQTAMKKRMSRQTTQVIRDMTQIAFRTHSSKCSSTSR